MAFRSYDGTSLLNLTTLLSNLLLEALLHCFHLIIEFLADGPLFILKVEQTVSWFLSFQSRCSGRSLSMPGHGVAGQIRHHLLPRAFFSSSMLFIPVIFDILGDEVGISANFR